MPVLAQADTSNIAAAASNNGVLAAGDTILSPVEQVIINNNEGNTPMQL